MKNTFKKLFIFLLSLSFVMIITSFNIFADEEFTNYDYDTYTRVNESTKNQYSYVYERHPTIISAGRTRYSSLNSLQAVENLAGSGSNYMYDFTYTCYNYKKIGTNIEHSACAYGTPSMSDDFTFMFKQLMDDDILDLLPEENTLRLRGYSAVNIYREQPIYIDNVLSYYVYVDILGQPIFWDYNSTNSTYSTYYLMSQEDHYITIKPTGSTPYDRLSLNVHFGITDDYYNFLCEIDNSYFSQFIPSQIEFINDNDITGFESFNGEPIKLHFRTYLEFESSTSSLPGFTASVVKQGTKNSSYTLSAYQRKYNDTGGFFTNAFNYIGNTLTSMKNSIISAINGIEPGDDNSTINIGNGDSDVNINLPNIDIDLDLDELITDMKTNSNDIDIDDETISSNDELIEIAQVIPNTFDVIMDSGLSIPIVASLVCAIVGLIL